MPGAGSVIVRQTNKWAVIGLAAVLAAGGVGCDRGAHPNQLGQVAPQFTLNDGSQSVDLAKLRGHVVVLNFWATWCAPCIQELPSLTAMQQQLPEVHVVAVSTDEDEAAYQRFIKRYPYNLLTVHDPAQKSNALYGSFRFPETYVIDKNGIVRRKFIGAQDWTSPEIVNFLRKLSA
jgi:cytochrome c biogenesis protein CcmG/thiol:disulfide interchange protein DsbE